MTSTSDSSKPLIVYPTDWTYTVIGEHEDQLRMAIVEVILQDIKDISFSARSSGGKYCSLHVTLEVQSEENRDEVHRALSGHSHIRFVL